MTLDHWIPALLNGYALHNHTGTGECSDQDSDDQTEPDNPDLDFIAHNPKQKHAHSHLAHAYERDAGHLAEQFILGCFEVCGHIANICT